MCRISYEKLTQIQSHNSTFSTLPHGYHALSGHAQTEESKILNSEPKDLAEHCHQPKESANDFQFDKKSKKVKK